MQHRLFSLNDAWFRLFMWELCWNLVEYYHEAICCCLLLLPHRQHSVQRWPRFVAQSARQQRVSHPAHANGWRPSVDVHNNTLRSGQLCTGEKKVLIVAIALILGDLWIIEIEQISFDFMVISQNIVIVNFLFMLMTFQSGIMAFLTSIHCCPEAHWSVQTKQRENFWTAIPTANTRPDLTNSVNDCVSRMVVESILLNQIKWSWQCSFHKTMFYLMKSKYAVYFNIKETKIERYAFFGTLGIGLDALTLFVPVTAFISAVSMVGFWSGLGLEMHNYN